MAQKNPEKQNLINGQETLTFAPAATKCVKPSNSAKYAMKCGKVKK